MKKTLIMLLLCLLLPVCVPVGAMAAQTQDVTVTASTGLDAALSQVADGGTVHVEGSVAVPSGFNWADHGMTVTITGGTLDFSALSTVTIRDNVCFQDITLTFAPNATVYAGGKAVTIAQTVTMTNPVTLYGGGNGGTVASTDLTVLAGTYNKIYGGSRTGTVTGDTHLTVGGTVNATIDETDHGGSNNVYGGSYQGTVQGTSHLTFTGNAKAHYVYGGNHSSGTIPGGCVAVFSGGKAMHLSGGSQGTDHMGDVDLTVTGGQLEQIFAACNGSALTGNVTVKVLGGTITRRVYGGCYNETSGLGFSTARYVTGNITLIIGGDAKITFTSSESDRSIYAHSRHKTLSATEVTQIIFADAAAYKSYANKLAAQDFAMKIIMMGVSAADSTHYYTYSADGATVKQACSYHSGESASASLSLNSEVSLVYNGQAIQPAVLTCSAGWFGDAPVVSYSNNVNAGTATATAAKGDVTAAFQFTIAPAPQSAPVLEISHETIRGKADGKLLGLTAAMDFSTDGVSFQPVSDLDMLLAAGTYYVRYAAKPNYAQSDVTTASVSQGRPLKVTFLAEGSAVAVKEVSWNGSVTDFPQIPGKVGHDQTAPVWEVTELTGLQSDRTVNALYTANTYKVTYIADGKTVAEQTVAYGQNAVPPAIPPKEGYLVNAPYWDNSGENITSDTVITAVYVEDPAFVKGWNLIDGKWCFFDEAGQMLCSQWIRDSVGWCYVGADGWMRTNAWVRDSVGWCYIGSDGYAVTNCWKRDSVGWCYLNSEGSMTKNAWVLDGGKWYWLDGNGYMVSNKWMKDFKGWVYLGADGAMMTNAWVRDSVGWCYVGADGYAVTNCWKRDSVGWCYLNSEGSMTKNAWVLDGGEWYYCGGEGYMVTGWKWIGGYEYYFYSSGVMAANTRIDGYWVDASGKYIPGK